MASDGQGAQPGQQGDVALLVDWENLKFSLAQRERRPNVTALRQAAEQFGRIVYARAYADWQDPVHKDDPASLYMAGLEPVYVLTKRYSEASGEIRIKNSVDVKLAADCIEASHQFPNIGTYIIVSGDHGFLHVVNTLRPHGKRVVVIGVSWTTANQLTDQADVVLYYDLDVERVLADGAQPAPPSPPGPAKKLSPLTAQMAETALGLIRAGGASADLDQRKVGEVLDLVLAVTREYRSDGRELSVSLLGQELQKRMNAAEFQMLVKGRARAFAQALENHHQVKLRSRDFVDWIYLPDEPEELIAATIQPSQERPRYDYAGLVFSDLAVSEQDALVSAINDERNRPGVDYLNFNKVREVVLRVTGKDDYSAKNLVNNMIDITVLRRERDRQGYDHESGSTYTFPTFSLDLQHPDVRRALRLG